jgi:mono/diheme cytochrome c family protein
MRIRIVLLVVLAACDLTYTPDVGVLAAPDAADSDAATDAPPGANPRCADSDPDTAVSFSRDIEPLLARSPGSCTGCHGASATSGFTVLTYDGLRRGGQVSGLEIVVAGKPCDSSLLQKLGPAPPYGARMPYNGPPYYSTDDLALLRDWIAEGAHDN